MWSTLRLYQIVFGSKGQKKVRKTMASGGDGGVRSFTGTSAAKAAATAPHRKFALHSEFNFVKIVMWVSVST